jgi:hypothetical protein
MGRATALAVALVLGAVVASASSAAARCIPLGDMLPEPSTPSAVVFIGTVIDVRRTTTDLAVEAWYFGEDPAGEVSVSGGRSPGRGGSEDWHPDVGQTNVVEATRKPSGELITTICHQSSPYPELLAALETAYGQPLVPPLFVPASPAPMVLPSDDPWAVDVSPAPSPSVIPVAP